MKNIILIILTILVIGLGVFIFVDKKNSKTPEVTNKPKQTANWYQNLPVRLVYPSIAFNLSSKYSIQKDFYTTPLKGNPGYSFGQVFSENGSDAKGPFVYSGWRFAFFLTSDDFKPQDIQQETFLGNISTDGLEHRNTIKQILKKDTLSIEYSHGGECLDLSSMEPTWFSCPDYQIAAIDIDTSYSGHHFSKMYFVNHTLSQQEFSEIIETIKSYTPSGFEGPTLVPSEASVTYQ
jgi:hypothetical protein